MLASYNVRYDVPVVPFALDKRSRSHKIAYESLAKDEVEVVFCKCVGYNGSRIRTALRPIGCE